MSRSKWKGPYTVPKNLKTIDIKKQLNIISPRNVEITPKLVNLTFKVHNGKEYQEVIVTENMIGHKFGEFAFTRAKFSFKKKNKTKFSLKNKK
jgi:ribosomal protein S19